MGQRDSDQGIFNSRVGRGQLSPDPVTRTRGDFWRLKDTQDRHAVLGPIPLAGLRTVGHAHIWRPGCVSLQPPVRRGWYK